MCVRPSVHKPLPNPPGIGLISYLKLTNIRACTVLILVAADVDGLCASRSLTHLLRADQVTYSLVPVQGYSHVAALLRGLGESNNDIRTVILVNCGAIVNLGNLLPWDRPDLACYVMDSHRPIHLANVYDKERVFVLHDEEEDMVAASLPSDGEDLSGGEESSSDEEEEEDGDEDGDGEEEAAESSGGEEEWDGDGSRSRSKAEDGDEVSGMAVCLRPCVCHCVQAPLTRSISIIHRRRSVLGAGERGRGRPLGRRGPQHEQRGHAAPKEEEEGEG